MRGHRSSVIRQIAGNGVVSEDKVEEVVVDVTVDIVLTICERESLRPSNPPGLPGCFGGKS